MEVDKPKDVPQRPRVPPKPSSKPPALNSRSVERAEQNKPPVAHVKPLPKCENKDIVGEATPKPGPPPLPKVPPSGSVMKDTSIQWSQVGPKAPPTFKPPPPPVSKPQIIKPQEESTTKEGGLTKDKPPIKNKPIPKKRTTVKTRTDSQSSGSSYSSGTRSRDGSIRSHDSNVPNENVENPTISKHVDISPSKVNNELHNNNNTTGNGENNNLDEQTEKDEVVKEGETQNNVTMNPAYMTTESIKKSISPYAISNVVTENGKSDDVGAGQVNAHEEETSASPASASPARPPRVKKMKSKAKLDTENSETNSGNKVETMSLSCGSSKIDHDEIQNVDKCKGKIVPNKLSNKVPPVPPKPKNILNRSKSEENIADACDTSDNKSSRLLNVAMSKRNSKSFGCLMDDSLYNGHSNEANQLDFKLNHSRENNSKKDSNDSSRVAPSSNISNDASECSKSANESVEGEKQRSNNGSKFYVKLNEPTPTPRKRSQSVEELADEESRKPSPSSSTAESKKIITEPVTEPSDVPAAVSSESLNTNEKSKPIETSTPKSQPPPVPDGPKPTRPAPIRPAPKLPVTKPGSVKAPVLKNISENTPTSTSVSPTLPVKTTSVSSSTGKPARPAPPPPSAKPHYSKTADKVVQDDVSPTKHDSAVKMEGDNTPSAEEKQPDASSSSSSVEPLPVKKSNDPTEDEEIPRDKKYDSLGYLKPDERGNIDEEGYSYADADDTSSHSSLVSSGSHLYESISRNSDISQSSEELQLPKKRSQLQSHFYYEIDMDKYGVDSRNSVTTSESSSNSGKSSRSASVSSLKKSRKGSKKEGKSSSPTNEPVKTSSDENLSTPPPVPTSPRPGKRSFGSIQEESKSASSPPNSPKQSQKANENDLKEEPTPSQTPEKSAINTEENVSPVKPKLPPPLPSTPPPKKFSQRKKSVPEETPTTPPLPTSPKPKLADVVQDGKGSDEEKKSPPPPLPSLPPKRSVLAPTVSVAVNNATPPPLPSTPPPKRLQEISGDQTGSLTQLSPSMARKLSQKSQKELWAPSSPKMNHNKSPQPHTPPRQFQFPSVSKDGDADESEINLEDDIHVEENDKVSSLPRPPPRRKAKAVPQNEENAADEPMDKMKRESIDPFDDEDDVFGKFEAEYATMRMFESDDDSDGTYNEEDDRKRLTPDYYDMSGAQFSPALLRSPRSPSSREVSYADSTCSEVQSGSEDEKQEEKAKRKAQKVFNIAQEMMTSEQVFVDVLTLLNIDFRFAIAEATEEAGQVIIPNTVLNQILNYLPELQSFNQDLLKDLTNRINNWESDPRVADIFVKKGPFLKLYTTYIKDFEKQSKSLDEACKNYPKFTEALRAFEASERCAKMDLRSYMLKPIQRIPQYKLLLEDYKKHLTEDSADYNDTKLALAIVSEVANHANEAMHEGDQFQKLLQVQEVIVGSFEVVRPGRKLLKSGIMQKLSRKVMQPRMFFLFNDVLLYTTPMTGNSYKLNHVLSLAGMKVNIPKQEDFQNELSIISVERSFTVSVSTCEERDRWLYALNTSIKDFANKRSTFEAVKSQQMNITQDMSFVLGSAAPVWIPDARVTMCALCTAEFTVTWRRHHCRACGKVVCGNCSDNKAPLAYLKNKAARVCDSCYEKLVVEKGLDPDAQSIASGHSGDGDMKGRSSIKSRLKSFRSSTWITGSRKARPSVLKEVAANDQGSAMSGYLKVYRIKKWKKMWFVVKENVLYTYRASEDTAAIESTPLLGYEIHSFGEWFEGVEPSLVFQITHQGRQPVIFRTESSAAKEKWVSAMREATVP